MPGLRTYTERSYLEEMLKKSSQRIYKFEALDVVDIGSIARKETPSDLVSSGNETIEFKNERGILYVLDVDWIPLTEYKSFEVILDSYPRCIDGEQSRFLTQAKSFILEQKKKEVIKYFVKRIKNCIKQMNTHQGQYRIQGELYIQYDVTREVCYFSEETQRSIKFDLLRVFQYLVNLMVLLNNQAFFSQSNKIPSIVNKITSLVPYYLDDDQAESIVSIYMQLLDIYYTGYQSYNDQKSADKTVIEYNVSGLSVTVKRAKEILESMVKVLQTKNNLNLSIEQ